jgi:retron-type reverse transcriptase
MVEEQCGFRKGRSCTDAIFTMQQLMEKRKEHNLPLFLLFIDYEKAYDNVNRHKLWEMIDNKIPNYLLNTIKCIYRNTKIRIKFNGCISETIHIDKGVRQGCDLSPVLFNIYINKIIQEFKRVIKNYIQLNNRKLVNTTLYADGQILMATSEDDLQAMAHHLNLIARKYKMTISSTKTKPMAMCGNHIQRVKIVINDNIIEK